MNSLKFIGIWTRSLMDTHPSTREKIEKEFSRVSKLSDDWFYRIEIDGNKFYIADNGEFGYTAMLPEEY